MDFVDGGAPGAFKVAQKDGEPEKLYRKEDCEDELKLTAAPRNPQQCVPRAPCRPKAHYNQVPLHVERVVVKEEAMALEKAP